MNDNAEIETKLNRVRAIRRALGELDRVRVAYARGLQSDVAPPDLDIQTKASIALQEIEEAM